MKGKLLSTYFKVMLQKTKIL